MLQSLGKQHSSRNEHRGVNLQVCRVVIHRDVGPAGSNARRKPQKHPGIPSDETSLEGAPGLRRHLPKTREAANLEVHATVRGQATVLPGTKPATPGFALLLLVLALPAITEAAVTGKVLNRTTGQPGGGILVTLLKFEAGMDPIEEVRTDANGSFSFQKPLVGANGSAVPGMVRTEFEGVSYSEMIPPGKPSEGLEIPVYSVDDKQALEPRGHIMIFEPGAGEMVVNENFVFLNESDPPRTFRDAENGSLRFYLPPEAKGIVQVRTAGPQRMPLRSLATPAGPENIYKVDFPLKPGDNSIDLTYLVPFTEGAEFEGRLLYEGLDTRIAAPAGVSLDAAGLVSLGEEPRTKASIYELPAAASFRVKISGQGQLAGSRGSAESASTSGGGSDVKIAPAPVAKELYWILGLTAAVLVVGFFYLYTAKPPDLVVTNAATDPATAESPAAARRAVSGARAQPRPAPQRKS